MLFPFALYSRQYRSKGAEHVIRHAGTAYGRGNVIIPFRVGPLSVAVLGPRPDSRPPPEGPPLGWKYPPPPGDYEGTREEWWADVALGVPWTGGDNNIYERTGAWSYTTTPPDP